MQGQVTPHPEVPELPSAGETLMPNAIPIPGVLHMTHNLAKDLGVVLEHWAEHYKRLKQLEKLLRSHRRERLFARILVPAKLGEDALAKFRAVEATLYEERWMEVVKLLEQIQEVLPILQQHWSEQRFGPQHSGPTTGAPTDPRVDCSQKREGGESRRERERECGREKRREET